MATDTRASSSAGPAESATCSHEATRPCLDSGVTSRAMTDRGAWTRPTPRPTRSQPTRATHTGIDGRSRAPTGIAPTAIIAPPTTGSRRRSCGSCTRAWPTAPMAHVSEPRVTHQAEDASDHPCTRWRISGIMTARPTCEAIALSLARIADGIPRRDTNVPCGRRRGSTQTAMHAPRAKTPNCARGVGSAPASWSNMTPIPTSPASRERDASTGERCPCAVGIERRT